MLSRIIGWLILFLVAVAATSDYRERVANKGSDLDITVNGFRKGNPEWSVVESDQKFQELAGSKHVVVDRTFVAARSPVFDSILQRLAMGPAIGQPAVPFMVDPVLRQMAAYLQNFQDPQVPRVFPQQPSAASVYSAQSLRAECDQQLVAEPLSVETAVATAVHAIRHSCSEARQAAVDFIKDHLRQVLNTQGWAHAVQTQPEEVVQLSRLLSERLSATRTPAAVQTEATPTTQPHGDHSQAPITTTPPVATCPTTPLDDEAISILRSLPEEDKGRRLMKAVTEENVEGVRALLSAGAFPGQRDEHGRTALHWAAWFGNVEEAACLLEAGADVDGQDNSKYRPLHRAAMTGLADMVRLLAAWGADPDAKDTWGWTPLHLTVRELQPIAARALLEAGADPDVKNQSGLTPLDMARRQKMLLMIDVLTQS